MLLFSFVAFIVHASIFCLRFFQIQSAFTSQKNTGEMFLITTSSKSTCKNSGTFEEKQILPEKVTCVPLAPSHSITDQTNYKEYFKQSYKLWTILYPGRNCNQLVTNVTEN